MDITTPQLLYHGTTSNTVQSFGQKLLNSPYWRPGKDFGEGFYTTISLAQARKWSHKAAKESWEGGRPCVLVVELTSVPDRVEPEPVVIFIRLAGMGILYLRSPQGDG